MIILEILMKLSRFLGYALLNQRNVFTNLNKIIKIHNVNLTKNEKKEQERSIFFFFFFNKLDSLKK